MNVPLLEPPPPVRPAFAVAATVLILLPAAAGTVLAAVMGEPPPTPLIVALVMFVVPVVGGLIRLFRKRRTGALVVDNGRMRVELPGVPILDVALDELRVLRAAKVGLILGVEKRALVIPAASLAAHAGAATMDDVRAQLLDHVRALPPSERVPVGGARLAEFLAERDAAAGAIEKRPLVVTWSVAALIAAVFAVEVAAGAMFDRHVLLALGAARRDLVLPGGLAAGALMLTGLWRIPAAALLHGHLLHLALNAMSLLVLGPVLERWLAKWRYVLVLMGSALVGTGASALLRDDVATVGLSGGLFGMLGALATTTWKYRRAPLVGPRLPVRSWVILVVANAVLTASPGVDAWAHVAGAIAGALIAWPLTPSMRRVIAPAPPSSAASMMHSNAMNPNAMNASSPATQEAPAFERVPSFVKEPAARVLACVVLAMYVVGIAGIAHAAVIILSSS